MSYFTASKSKKDLDQASGSKYLKKGGFYPVTILAGFITVSKNGSETIDLFVEHQGQKQVIYGNMMVKKNNGDLSEIGSKIANQLLVVTGIDELSDPEEIDLPIGKKGVDKTVSAFPELEDLEVIVRIGIEYSEYKGNYGSKTIIKGFYRDDKASASEVANDSEVGLQYSKDEEYGNADKYDGVTPEGIAEWVKGGFKKGTANSKASAKKTAPDFKGGSKFANK